MKLSKNDLKIIVKECLLEILQEGLNTHVIDNASPRERVVESNQRRSVLPKQAKPQTMQRQPQPTDLLKQAILSEAKGDPVMASILADTAMTSLQQTLSADRKPSLEEARNVSNAIVDDAVEDNEQFAIWQQLAYSDSKVKR